MPLKQTRAAQSEANGIEGTRTTCMMADGGEEEGVDVHENELQRMSSALSQGFYPSELVFLKTKTKSWNFRSRQRLSCLVADSPHGDQIIQGIDLPPPPPGTGAPKAEENAKKNSKDEARDDLTNIALERRQKKKADGKIQSQRMAELEAENRALREEMREMPQGSNGGQDEKTQIRAERKKYAGLIDSLQKQADVEKKKLEQELAEQQQISCEQEAQQALFDDQLVSAVEGAVEVAVEQAVQTTRAESERERTSLTDKVVRKTKEWEAEKKNLQWDVAEKQLKMLTLQQQLDAGESSQDIAQQLQIELDGARDAATQMMTVMTDECRLHREMAENAEALRQADTDRLGQEIAEKERRSSEQQASTQVVVEQAQQQLDQTRAELKEETDRLAEERTWHAHEATSSSTAWQSEKDALVQELVKKDGVICAQTSRLESQQAQQGDQVQKLNRQVDASNAELKQMIEECHDAVVRNSRLESLSEEAKQEFQRQLAEKAQAFQEQAAQLTTETASRSDMAAHLEKKLEQSRSAYEAEVGRASLERQQLSDELEKTNASWKIKSDALRSELVEKQRAGAAQQESYDADQMLQMQAALELKRGLDLLRPGIKNQPRR